MKARLPPFQVKAHMLIAFNLLSCAQPVNGIASGETKKERKKTFSKNGSPKTEYFL